MIMKGTWRPVGFSAAIPQRWMCHVWHRDGSVLSDIANSCNFGFDLIIGVNDNPGNRDPEKDNPVVKDYLDVVVVRAKSIGISQPRIASRPVLANKVYDALAQTGIFDKELVDECRDPCINNGLLYDSGSDTIICLIGLKSLFDILVYRRFQAAVHSNSGLLEKIGRGNVCK